MCGSRLFDIFSVAVSILAGIVLTVLAFLNLLTSFLIGPWIAIALAAFSLLVLTLASTSLLRQDRSINACVCQKGRRLLWSATTLFTISVFAVLFALTNLLISLLLVFLIASLFVFTLFNLYCLLVCIATSGCCDCCD